MASPIKCFFYAEWHRERGYVAVELRLDGHRYVEYMNLARFGEFCVNLKECVTIGEWGITYAPTANSKLVTELRTYFQQILADIVNTLSDEANGGGLTE